MPARRWCLVGAMVLVTLLAVGAGAPAQAAFPAVLTAPHAPLVNHPPYFVYPPTPPDGTTFTVIAGNNLTFDVRAQDDDIADIVTLGVVGLPSGASFPIPP